MIVLIASYCRFLLVGASFLALLIFLWRSRKILKNEFLAIPQIYRWSVLILMLAPYVFYISYMFPKHVIGDELAFEMAAKNILTLGPLGNIPKSVGWIFLIALGYLVTGINNIVSLQISQLLGAGTIAGIFFLATWAGFSRRTSIVAALLFTFVPSRMFWAGTGETHIPTVFFTVWAMAFSFLLCRKIDRSIFALAISFWVFAVLVRSETIVLFLFFLAWIRLFIPKQRLKELPFGEAAFWTGIILIPHIISSMRHAFEVKWNGSDPNIGAGNLWHNTINYGVPFLTGAIHPVILSLTAIIGAVVLFSRDKKTAAVLIGWFVLVTGLYFSLWFQSYGGGSVMFPKTALFIFFYPPLVIFAANGIFWMAEKSVRRYTTYAVTIICLMTVAWCIHYYKTFPIGKNAFTLQMQVVEDIPRLMQPKDIAITCYPQSFFPTMNFFQFDNEPETRARIFKNALKVYLLDDLQAQLDCPGQADEIGKKGNGVLVKEWFEPASNSRFRLYSLSAF